MVPDSCRHGLLIDACSVHGLMRARQMTARSALDEVTDTSAFDRSPSTFRSSVSRDGRFPVVAGRYHLYVSYACPWASRCLAFLKLKGLDHAIGVTVRR
jgi:glutathionyl-hydroquinone reductase